MMTWLAPLLLSVLSSPRILGDETDLLVLADGKRQVCRVLLDTDQKVVYRVKSKTNEVPRGDVKEIQSVERSLRAYLAMIEKTDPRDVKALSDLALYAETSDLPGEANNTWIRVLSIDPENAQAWTKMGGAKRRTGWELKVRGRYYTLDELRTRVSDWKNALELRTAHFLVKTDAEPERALDVALDVERAYMTFYDVLCKPLELYVLDEIPEIQIFADPKDYPSPPVAGRPAWFDRSANALYVNRQQATEYGGIVAEFTEALIFNAFRRTLGKTGELEPWAREGLKQAFGAAVRPNPGRVVFDFASPYRPHFQAQASDAKALALSQLLRAGLASFDSGSDQARYTAQSYTLLHFLAFYENQKYRTGLANFLRDSYLGKGGNTNFFKAIGADEKTLESQWNEYVKKMAAG
jgi:hypothetical protein